MEREWTEPLEQGAQDVILQSVLRFLVEGNDIEAARSLLICNVLIEVWMEFMYSHEWGEIDGQRSTGSHQITILAPRKAYDQLTDEENPFHQVIWKAFAAVTQISRIDVRAQLHTVANPDWKNQIQAEIDGGGRSTNQGLRAEKSSYFAEWQGLRFASQSEIRIAQALDEVGVLYFPTCVARLGKPSGRKNLEADFLIFHKGKYGIIEVDGPTHKQAAKDHDRDRQFKAFGGIMTVERFTSDECFENPDAVVKKFLYLLENQK